MADGETEVGGYNLPKATQPAGRGVGFKPVRASPGLMRFSPGAGRTHGKGLRRQNHTQGGEKGQSGEGAITSGCGPAELALPLTLADQSHSSCLPQFIHFTTGYKILHSPRGVRIMEQACFK